MRHGAPAFWSVRTQVTLLGVGAALLLAIILAGDALVLRGVRDRYDLEDQRSTVIRARVAIRQAIEADRIRLTESAWWDDVYDYMTHPTGPTAKSFLKENFVDWLPAQYGDRFIGFWRADRSPLWHWHDSLSANLDDLLPTNAIFDLLDRSKSAAGYVALGGRIYAVAGSLVLPGSGIATNPRGYLVTMRPLNDTTAQRLEQSLQQHLTLRPVIPARDSIIRLTFAGGDSVATRFRVGDLFERPTVLLELRSSRTFLADVETWMSRSLVFALALAGLLLGLLALVASRLLLRPFARIERQFTRMREEGRIGRLSQLSSAQEWGLVVGSFNQLADAREQAERSLAEARDQALAATEAKSEFLANMSHEIRTPMNAILGLSDLLRQMPVTAEQRRFLDAVHGSGEALLALVNDILDLSKVEAGKIVLETIPFDLHCLVHETMAMFVMRAEERGIALETTLGPGVPERVLGDPGRLRQILINLAGNALKFTREGAVRIRVECPGPDEEIRFEVEDTGVGIPPEKLDRVFEKYSQVDATTTRKFGGTGLGLTISRELLTLMGGHMTVTSEVGKGSVFSFSLMLATCVGVPARLPRNVPLTGCRLLQVGLDGFAHPDRTALLRSAGIQVSEILSSQPPAGALLQAAAAEEPYGVVLIDAERMSARLEQIVSACRREAWPAVAIVVIVERGEPGSASKIHSAGAHACLFESVTREDLLESIAVARQVVQGQLTWPLITRHWLLEARFAETEVYPTHAESQSPPRALRVLVTDDNELNRLVAGEYLKRLGCDVATAPGGSEAIELVRRGGLDLVFMDCQMPEMDGYQATGEIRALGEAGAGLPIVAMTANAMRGDRERCIAAGMDDYVSKPVNEADLARVLKRWGGVRTTSMAAPPAHSPIPERRETAEPAALAGLSASGPGGALLAERLTERFLRDTPAQVTELGEAVTRNDRALAARVARTLRGSAGVIGAQGIRDLCQLIESALERGAAPEAWAGQARLEHEATKVMAALREAQGSPSEAPPLDSEKLAEYLQMEASMPGLLSELVTAFLQDAPTRITTAELALAEGNANRARDAAHALKGAALQMGTLPLGRAAAELEREAQAGSLEQGRALLERIVTEFDRARPVLEQYLAAAQPSGVA